MNAFAEFLGQAVRGLFKLFAVALLAALVVSLLLTGVCVALLSVVWSLLRGRRPAVVSVFQTFQRASQPFARRTGAAPTAHADDVVDVQAHEVRQSLTGRIPQDQD